MARERSAEKRAAILEAAVHEIAASGLGAATAKIAQRAGIASGTLFTYFPNKEELLNEVYLELKSEVYARMNASFPHKGSLERRVRHVWTSYLDWTIAFPEKRKVSAQLHVSDVITAETRKKAALGRGPMDATLSEVENRRSLGGLPQGLAMAMMGAMQDATIEFIQKQPKQRRQITDRAFEVFWRAMR
jgi:AcrR family transcriptional regulator